MVLADLQEIEEEMTNAQFALKRDVNKSIVLLLQEAKDEIDRINDINTKHKYNKNEENNQNQNHSHFNMLAENINMPEGNINMPAGNVNMKTAVESSTPSKSSSSASEHSSSASEHSSSASEQILIVGMDVEGGEGHTRDEDRERQIRSEVEPSLIDHTGVRTSLLPWKALSSVETNAETDDAAISLLESNAPMIPQLQAAVTVNAAAAGVIAMTNESRAVLLTRSGTGTGTGKEAGTGTGTGTMTRAIDSSSITYPTNEEYPQEHTQTHTHINTQTNTQMPESTHRPGSGLELQIPDLMRDHGLGEESSALRDPGSMSSKDSDFFAFRDEPYKELLIPRRDPRSYSTDELFTRYPMMSVLVFLYVRSAFQLHFRFFYWLIIVDISISVFICTYI